MKFFAQSYKFFYARKEEEKIANFHFDCELQPEPKPSAAITNVRHAYDNLLNRLKDKLKWKTIATTSVNNENVPHIQQTIPGFSHLIDKRKRNLFFYYKKLLVSSGDSTLRNDFS